MIISPDFMYKIKCIGMILQLSNVIALQGTVLLTGFGSAFSILLVRVETHYIIMSCEMEKECQMVKFLS